MNDLISVIIPVKNGSIGNYLNQAIEGILAQKMNVEIIIVDDCSTDNTVEIAESYGCKIIKHEFSKGAVAAKNSGLRAAKGKYILFHDHDDIMKNGALKQLHDEFTPDIMAVEAKIQDWYSPDLTEKERTKISIKQDAYWGLFTGAILIKKEVFDTIGLFDEVIKAGEIIDWCTKMDSSGFKIKKVDFVSTLRRIHSNNFGRTSQKSEFKDYAAILRAKLKNKK